jgi:hypothetical protein
VGGPGGGLGAGGFQPVQPWRRSASISCRGVIASGPGWADPRSGSAASTACRAQSQRWQRIGRGCRCGRGPRPPTRCIGRRCAPPRRGPAWPSPWGCQHVSAASYLTRQGPLAGSAAVDGEPLRRCTDAIGWSPVLHRALAVGVAEVGEGPSPPNGGGQTPAHPPPPGEVRRVVDLTEPRLAALPRDSRPLPSRIGNATSGITPSRGRNADSTRFVSPRPRPPRRAADLGGRR